jgi:glycine/D-amino acid oxidase-like deaminating enzyme/nitrite reductase/ring-hydroxylating ferredoxin subunit
MIQQHNSIWKTTSSSPTNFPTLNKSFKAEIVIVGGGISGLSAAYLLSKTGKKVVVIEASQIGMGTTGNSTGNLYSLIDHPLSELIDKWGEEKAKKVIKSREEAITHIEMNSQELGIECSFQRVNFSYFVEHANPEHHHFVERESKAAQTLGLNCKKQTKLNALPFVTELAIEFPNQAQFHPLNYVVGLAKKLPSNVEIYESTPVLDIDYKKKQVICSAGVVEADKIIVATAVPKGICPVQFKLHPIREYGVAAELKEGDFPGVYWSMDKDRRSVRSLNINNKKYAMVIGKKYKTGHHDQEKLSEVNELNNYLSKHFITNEERTWWSAQTYQSADMLPYIGEFTKDCYSLTGFSTDGLVYGVLGAMIITDKIMNKNNPYSDLYDFKRCTLLKSAKVMAKEAVDNLCQYASDLPKKHTVQLEDIKMNEGGIIEREGEKLAVFKSEAGIKCVSAVCTHMKCIVRFNPNEKTWDCPCHASRFSVEGKVLEGPALKNLEEKKL